MVNGQPIYTTGSIDANQQAIQGLCAGDARFDTGADRPANEHGPDARFRVYRPRRSPLSEPSAPPPPCWSPWLLPALCGMSGSIQSHRPPGSSDTWHPAAFEHPN